MKCFLCALFTLSLGFCCGLYWSKSNQFVESESLDYSFRESSLDGLLDDCFRLRTEKYNVSDVQSFVSRLFRIWISDPELYAKVKKMKFAFSEVTIEQIKKEAGVKDPLNITRFGKTSVASDAKFVAFSVMSNDSTFRLELIPRHLNKVEFASSYSEMSDAFIRDFPPLF